MANSPSDELKRSREADDLSGRCHETIVMDRRASGEEPQDDVASRAMEDLDDVSGMLEAVQSGEVDVAQPGDGPVPTGKDADTADDPSIEEYMSALLARSRDPRTMSADAMLKELRAAQALARAAAQAKASEIAATTISEWSPSPAPECREAISELRELANISARSSFNIYRGQRLVFDMHSKMFVAFVALVASGALISVTPSMRAADILRRRCRHDCRRRLGTQILLARPPIVQALLRIG